MRALLALVLFATIAHAAPPVNPSPTRAPTPKPPSPYEGDGWKVTASAPKDGKVGDKAKLEIAVEARAGFHLNDDFPINFVVTAQDGIAFDAARVDKKSATLAPCRSGEHACKASMPISFTPKSEGARTVKGTFSFAVCDEKQCLIEKVPVTADVVVAR